MRHLVKQCLYSHHIHILLHDLFLCLRFDFCFWIIIMCEYFIALTCTAAQQLPIDASRTEDIDGVKHVLDVLKESTSLPCYAVKIEPEESSSLK